MDAFKFAQKKSKEGLSQTQIVAALEEGGFTNRLGKPYRLGSISALVRGGYDKGEVKPKKKYKKRNKTEMVTLSVPEPLPEAHHGKVMCFMGSPEQMASLVRNFI